MIIETQKSTMIKLSIPDKPYSVLDMYRAVAKEMGYTNVDDLDFDCRKIDIAHNIQDGFFKYYLNEAMQENASINETEVRIDIAMLLMICGPKVDNALKANEVIIYDGFICNK